MTIIGYAAALEQFAPTELLNYSILAETDGDTHTQRLVRELCVAERVMCV